MIKNKFIIDSGAEFDTLNGAVTQQLIDEICSTIDIDSDLKEEIIRETLAYLRENFNIEDEINHWEMNTQYTQY